MPSLRESEHIISGLFLAVVLLACMEKLAATANTVAVERDWVCRNRAILLGQGL
jgi:iron-regulated transporter 1